MTKEEKVKMLKEAIEKAPMENVVYWWNEYATANACYDDEVYNNNDEVIDMLLIHSKPSEIYRTMTNGDYNYNDDYFCYDVYDHLNSFNQIEDEHCPIDVDAMAEYFVEWDVEDAFAAFSVDFGY